MNTIDQLFKTLGLDKPTDDAKAVKPIHDPLVGTSDVHFYVKGENETAEDFIKRVPPSEILRSGHADFIAIHSYRNIAGLRSFLNKGMTLLKRYEEKYVNETNAGPQALPLDEFKEEIFLLAIEENVLQGRYMLFPSTDVVDDVWLKVVQNTITGHLGINAEIDRKTSDYVIRVYTKDFTDEADMRRVFKALKDLKLLDDKARYTDTYPSKLGVHLGNILIKASSIFLDNDFIQLQDGDMCSLYGIKEKNESAESFVARLLPSKVLHSSNIYIALYNEEGDVYDKEAICTAKAVGNMLLEKYKSQIEKTPVPKRYSITRKLQKRLKKLAIDCNFVKGRWIAYTKDNVDSLWLKTVKGTMNGILGVNAIIKNYDNQYEISVITKAFTDEADVMRVLAEMKKLGFTSPLSYKTHLYLKLGILKKNVYGLKPNLHVESTEPPR